MSNIWPMVYNGTNSLKELGAIRRLQTLLSKKQGMEVCISVSTTIWNWLNCQVICDAFFCYKSYIKL